MLRWLKSTMAHLLGDKKDKVLKLPVINKLNHLANKKIDGDRQKLLKENAHQILKEFEEVYKRKRMNSTSSSLVSSMALVSNKK